jgi:OPA family glycerol-3-phosphate transporter-like MFS transporter/OPA family sugar phosphate sensor protein UhpC-like MFS transporter
MSLPPSVQSSAPAANPPDRFPGWLRIFRPAPDSAATLTEPVAIEEGYRFWRKRVLVSSIVGYATFYFVRKNLGIAMPLMEKDLGISKSDLGLFLTLHGVLYGVSKFANGFFGDRCNARAFMAVGLAASALMNIFFGFGSAAAVLGVVWMLNGWFQGMGFPPCARLLTHWFPPRDIPIKMSIWNISHSIGAGLIVVLCGYLAPVNWRLCFFVPAGLATVCAVYLWFNIPDTPPSVGLPEVPGTKVDDPAGDSRAKFSLFLMENVFNNKDIWLISLANFFVYTLRYAVLDWGPTMLTQAKHIGISHAGWMVAGFEFSGLIGALLGGWLTSRFFGGRAVRACVFYMALAGVSLLLFWKAAGESKFLNTTLLCCAGFFIYGPQCLVAIAAANLATKRAAATAIGLTGLFGYASTVFSGWGLGALVQHHGWDSGLTGLLITAGIGMLLFIAAWNAKAHGYKELV